MLCPLVGLVTDLFKLNLLHNSNNKAVLIIESVGWSLTIDSRSLEMLISLPEVGLLVKRSLSITLDISFSKDSNFDMRKEFSLLSLQRV